MSVSSKVETSKIKKAEGGWNKEIGSFQGENALSPENLSYGLKEINRRTLHLQGNWTI